MLVNLQTILKDAYDKGYAVPAFNVYNMETVMGVIAAAREAKSPGILQFYSRLATTGVAESLMPVVLHAAHSASVPVCAHLDHGSGFDAAAIAVKSGASGIMVDFSALDFESNVVNTAKAVEICSALNIGVAAEGVSDQYTEVKDAVEFVERTRVGALAVMVGTAHGRYKKAPVLAIERIKEIRNATKTPLVLHGGSGVPDDQVKAAIKAGICKVNFGTDLCYSFLDKIFETDRKTFAIDLFMRGPTDAVKAFALDKIRLLGAENRA